MVEFLLNCENVRWASVWQICSLSENKVGPLAGKVISNVRLTIRYWPILGRQIAK